MSTNTPQYGPLSMEAATAALAQSTRKAKIHAAARTVGMSDEEMELRADSYIPSPNGGFTLPITDGEKPVFDVQKPLELVVKDPQGGVAGRVVGGSGNFRPTNESPVQGSQNPTREHAWVSEQHARAKQAASDDPLAAVRAAGITPGQVQQPKKPDGPETRVMVLIGVKGTNHVSKYVASRAFLGTDKRTLILAFQKEVNTTTIPMNVELAVHLEPYSEAPPVDFRATHFGIFFQDPITRDFYLNLPLMPPEQPEQDSDLMMPDDGNELMNLTTGWEGL